MKNKKYHTFGTLPKYHTFGTLLKSNRKLVETEAKSTPVAHNIYDHSLSWLETCTSMKSGGAILILWVIYSFTIKFRNSGSVIQKIEEEFDDTKGR